MSILMDFYAVEHAKVEGFPVQGSAAHADFSLHLSPEDLDLLVAALAEIFDQPAEPFADHLSPLIVNAPPDFEEVDWEEYEPEPEIYLVSPKLTAQFAKLAQDQIEPLVKNWFGLLSEQMPGDPIAPSPDSFRAVRDLVQVCQTAMNTSLDVVYTWSL